MAIMSDKFAASDSRFDGCVRDSVCYFMRI